MKKIPKLKNLLENKKRARHHWWPKGLQKHWINENGQVNMRKGDKVEPKNPQRGKTGSIPNSHFFDVGDSPWSHSFEDAFQIVDSKGAEAVSRAINCIQRQTIYRLSQAKITSWLPFRAATTEISVDCLSNDCVRNLARIAISVVIRSPAFQFRKSFLHPAFPGTQVVNPELGKQNIWHYWAELYRNPHLPAEPLSIVFLASRRNQEFVIGDGFYQSVIDQKRFVKTPCGGWRPFYKGAILFPISPDICTLILFNSSIGQKLAILSNDETSVINEITCLNSRNEIYFRSQDHPYFEPNCETSVREIFLNENSFLQPWISTTKAQ